MPPAGALCDAGDGAAGTAGADCALCRDRVQPAGRPGRLLASLLPSSTSTTDNACVLLLRRQVAWAAGADGGLPIEQYDVQMAAADPSTGEPAAAGEGGGSFVYCGNDCGCFVPLPRPAAAASAAAAVAMHCRARAGEARDPAATGVEPAPLCARTRRAASDARTRAGRGGARAGTWRDGGCCGRWCSGCRPATQWATASGPRGARSRPPARHAPPHT